MIRTNKKLGVNCWLVKTDITDAFKVMPLALELWPYHGIKWNGRYYFFNRLVLIVDLVPRFLIHYRKQFVGLLKIITI